MRGLGTSPATRRWLLLACGAAFVAMTVSALRSLPDDGRSLNPWLVLILAGVTAPATILANAVEYRLIGALLRHRLTLRHSVRVALVAAVANYLPAPGGVAVRAAALTRAGSTVRSALTVNGAAAAVWLGLTGLTCGAALAVGTDRVGPGVLAFGGGAALLGSATALLWRRDPVAARGSVAALVAVELTVVLLSGARVFVSMRAIGQEVSAGAALGISAATVLASAIGIAPAGLGLREGIAALLASALGVPASAAIAASAIDRVAAQVGMAVVALAAGIRRRDLTGATAGDPDRDVAPGAGATSLGGPDPGR